MAQDIAVNERVQIARSVAETLSRYSMECLAAFWDRKSSESAWTLQLVLRSPPASALDFLMQLIAIRGVGQLPHDLELNLVRATSVDDPRAAAIVDYARETGKTSAYIQSTLLGRSYFEEAILGYLSPDYLVSRSAA